MGRWDVYYYLFEDLCIPKSEALLAANISPREFAEEEKRDELERMGVNPDDEDEVAEYERIAALSIEELERQIKALEKHKK